MVVRHILEAVFRHPIRLLILIVVLSTIGFGVAFVLPRSYTSTSKLWALRNYATDAAASNPNSIVTPAQSQTKALTELLGTRVFALTIAHQTPLLASALSLTGEEPALRDEALFTDLSKHVQVVAEGDNLFTVSYTSTNPQVAQEVVAEVIQNYSIQSRAFSTTENQSLLNLLKNYETQLATAKHDLSVATAAENQYLAAHPNLSQSQLLNDTQYVQLHVQTVQSQTTLQDTQNSINTVSQEITAVQGLGVDSLFTTLDAPEVPSIPVSRTPQLIIGGGIGLGVALLACALYLFVVIRRDRSIYTAYDLRNTMPFPVVMNIPHVTSTPLSQSIKIPANHNA